MGSRHGFSVCGATRVVLATAVLIAGPSFGRAREPRPPVTIEMLTGQLDRIEKEMARYGFICAKAPDVWGQARLMLHRDEFERQMVQQLGAFQPTLNAEVAMSDQAVFLESLSLAAALRGATSAAPASTGTSTSSTNNTTTTQVNLPVPITQVPTIQNTGTTGSGQITNGFFTRTPPFGSLQTTFGTGQQTILQMEPEELLDQRKRFLNHLHEIRRINEGDDTADSPGYSLDLVRIPVSLIPGDKSRQGYGAEITVTAEPYITEELLPVTFRDLVINDLVDQLSLPMLQMIDACRPDLEQLETSYRQYIGAKREFDRLKGKSDKLTKQYVDGLESDSKSKFSHVAEKCEGLRASLSRPSVLSRSRRARYALPPSQIGQVIGGDVLTTIVQSIFSVRDRKGCGAQIHIQEVQSYLTEELRGAFDLLCEESSTVASFDPHNGPVQLLRAAFRESTPMPLAKSIRNDDVWPDQNEQMPKHPENVARLREDFLNYETNKLRNSTGMITPIEALAWCVLVESALLNEQLNQDIQHVSQDPGCGCSAQPGLVFYGPNPSPQARQAFVQYVKCRWPIHIFAIDPDIQEQNVADSYSLRREMQVALALAVSGGIFNGQNMSTYMRRIELDMRTIDLNRTIVGFGDGDDTFGWRFYPRFQTPDIEGNATTFFRDFLVGGPSRDDVLRSQRIEPGTRECVAIVLMPSFIHHVRFDTRSEWFQLASCNLNCCTGKRIAARGDTGTHLKQALGWSRQLHTMEEFATACSHGQQCDCGADLVQLWKRTKQLEARLPQQTLFSKVPNDNTIGGFQMFSSGVTDLAPELIGYYGAPGIDPNSNTTLFLVGNHFSVHGTRVLAGTLPVQEAELLSREVMKVTIPAGVRTERRRRVGEGTQDTPPNASTPLLLAPSSPPSGPPIDEYGLSAHRPHMGFDRCDEGCGRDADEVVVLNLATPYGVTSNLVVPVQRETRVEPVIAWEPDVTGVFYHYAVASDGTFSVADADVYVSEPRLLKIRILEGILPPPTITAQVSFTGINTAVMTANTSLSLTANPKTGEYMLDPASFQQFHLAAKNAAIAYLAGKDAKNPPASFTLQATATVTTPTPTVGAFTTKNKLLINIQLVKK